MIKLTSDKCVDYIWFGDKCLKKARAYNLTANEAIQDGRTLVICKYNPREAIIIVIPSGDFIMHPRSGSLRKFSFYDSGMNSYTLTGVSRGGYTKVDGNYEELSAIDAYTLVDNDRGSFVVTIDDTDLEVDWADVEDNYGNVYWIGEGDTPPVLSWHGPPSIQFPLDKTYTIPGLTSSVSSSNTTFGVWIYQTGVRLCHGPQIDPDDEMLSLVVGASIAYDADGIEYLVAICISNKSNIKYLQIYKSIDTGTTWELIQEFVNRDCGTPAFISSNGRIFVYDKIKYLIAPDIKSVSKSEELSFADVFTRTVVGAGGYGSDYFYSGKQYLYPALDATDSLKYATAITTAKFEHIGNGDTVYHSAVTPVYRGNPATSVSISIDNLASKPCEVSGDGYILTFVAEANGNYCQAVWSGVHCYKDMTAVLKVGDCNSDFSVTVTLQPQGVSATLTRTQVDAGITIVGDDAIAVGNLYQANNAIGAVTWSISKGAIHPDTGVITSIEGASCGEAVVTATDSCTRTGTKSVRCPDGVWVETDYVGAYEYCNDYGMPQYWYVTTGSTRKSYRVYWDVAYDPENPPSGYGDPNSESVLFDNGIESNIWYGPHPKDDGHTCQIGGCYHGCGVMSYGSYIKYSATYRSTEEWQCQ